MLTADIVPFRVIQNKQYQPSKQPFGLNMDSAEQYLVQRGIPYTKCKGNALKFDNGISYWPRKGTLYIDGAEKREKESGPQALLDLLKRLGI